MIPSVGFLASGVLVSMHCEAVDTKVVIGDQELSLLDAVRLSADLAAAIRQVIEAKTRMTTTLIVLPTDAEWETTIAKLDV